MAMTSAERKRNECERKRKIGLVIRNKWLTNSEWEVIDRIIEKMEKQPMHKRL